MKRKKMKTFDTGTHVVVVRGPFKAEVGTVHEICDDADYVIVQFGRLKVRIACSVLAPAVLAAEKKQATKAIIKSSHRTGKTKK